MVQHLVAGCKKLAGTEYARKHDNALKVLAVKRAVKNGVVPEVHYMVYWKMVKRKGDWERRKEIILGLRE